MTVSRISKSWTWLLTPAWGTQLGGPVGQAVATEGLGEVSALRVSSGSGPSQRPEFVSGAIGAGEPKAAQLEDALEVSKRHLDLRASVTRGCGRGLGRGRRRR